MAQKRTDSERLARPTNMADGAARVDRDRDLGRILSMAADTGHRVLEVDYDTGQFVLDAPQPIKHITFSQKIASPFE